MEEKLSLSTKIKNSPQSDTSKKPEKKINRKKEEIIFESMEVEFGEQQIRSDFVSQQNNHLSNSLRFADAKAGALVTVNGIVLAYVIALLENSIGFDFWIFSSGLLLLIGGMLASIAVVFPKTMNSKVKGLVYWEHIINNTQDEYEERILVDNVDHLLKNSISNNYIQALILTKKFKQLKFSFQISLLGYLIILVGLFLALFS